MPSATEIVLGSTFSAAPLFGGLNCAPIRSAVALDVLGPAIPIEVRVNGLERGTQSFDLGLRERAVEPNCISNGYKMFLCHTFPFQLCMQLRQVCSQNVQNLLHMASRRLRGSPI